MDKADIRRQVKNAKATLSPEQKQWLSAEVMKRLEKNERFVEASVVLFYWSMADEVSTHAMIERWYEKKTILLPSVDGEDLLLRRYTGKDCLVAGEQFGIPEPMGEEYGEYNRIDMIVVPGVAFDKEGNRMGRGRGFYDRLLARVPRAYKVGVAFDCQMFDRIPTEEHDVPMNLVISC